MRLSTRDYSVRLTIRDTQNEQVYRQHHKELLLLIKAEIGLDIDPNMLPVTLDAVTASPWRWLRAAYAKRMYYLRHPKIFIRHMLLGLKLLRRKLFYPNAGTT